MKIETDFNIGDEFWMPRVRYEYIVDTKLFGGMEYERRSAILVPFAKLKRIFRISINLYLKHQNSIEYWCDDVLAEGEKPLFEGHNVTSLCSEKDFKYKNKDDALAFAQNWAATERMEYFGEKL